MKKIIISIIALCFANNLIAQSVQRSVIAAAGNTATSGNVTLSSTVGETFTNKLSSANNIITQGFQQGNITVARLSEGENENESENLANKSLLDQSGEIALNIFPNPTTDFVNIISESTEQITLTVLDASGKLIQQLQHSALQTQIDFTSLNIGIYFIVAQNVNGNSRNTYKVIKR